MGQADKLTFNANASSSAVTKTKKKEMAEAVMVKLEELGVGAWLAQGDRVIRSSSFSNTLHGSSFHGLCINLLSYVQMCPEPSR